MENQDKIRDHIGQIITNHKIDLRKMVKDMSISFTTLDNFMGGKKVREETAEYMISFVESLTDEKKYIYRRL
jgi:hypothetical protein